MADPHVAVANLTAMETLLGRLVQIRIEAGLTVEDVARKCGCEVSFIERFENMGYDPTLLELRLYAVSVGAIIDYAVVTDR